MKNIKKIYIIGLILCLFTLSSYSQEKKSNVNTMNDEEIAKLTDEQLIELSFEDLVSVSNKMLLNSGSTGSYSNTIQELTKEIKSKIKINGYFSINYDQPLYTGGISTFDLHYFSIYFSAQFSERLSAEMQLACEHAGQKVWPRTALVDYKIDDALIVRSGLFLIPAGHFNEYYDIDFINKMADRAYPNTEIAPSGWLDVGVQIRGRINKISKNFVPYYSFYVVNGSLQGDDGGRIRKMRDNWLDVNNTNKSLGGNIGAVVNNNLSVSASYYTGKYDAKGALNLGIGGASLSYTKNKFSIFSEYQFANQDYTNTDGNLDQLFKQGFYALVAYNFKNKIEPVVRYDMMKLGGDVAKDLQRVTLGLNYHFRKVCILKVNYQMVKNGGPTDKDDNMLLFQFATAF